jgi:hypothetical protein
MRCSNLYQEILDAAMYCPSDDLREGQEMIAHAATRKTITWLQINWKGVEANLGDTGTCDTSRSLRMDYATSLLGRPISTFNDLSQAEADRLVMAYKQELGEEFKGPGYGGGRHRQKAAGNGQFAASAYELLKLSEISCELWNGMGEDWFQLLCARVNERFGAANPQALTPRQAKYMVEELLQRLFVRDCRASGYAGEISRKMIEAGKEYLRAKFFTTGTPACGAADTARSGSAAEAAQ